MHEMAFLLKDPRPGLPDSRLWERLFRLCISEMEHNKQLAIVLLKRFWTMRSIGTIIRRTHVDTRFEPILEDDGGDWPDVESFTELRGIYLYPHAKEIKRLLDKL